VASDFYLMDKGRLVAEGPIADLSEEIIAEYLSV
jgi:ABC-type branched-subunit amino acid transport system ATPase component